MRAPRSKHSAENGHEPESVGNSADAEAPGSSKATSRNASRGRKRAYEPEFAHRAKQLCLNGATKFDLAIKFGVAASTIFEWQALHKEFAAACKVDPKVYTDRIEQSLAERAKGYDYALEEVRVVRGRLVPVSYIKHIPADVSAQKFWLMNREPKEWSTHPEPAPDADGSTPLSRLYDQLEGHKIQPNEKLGQKSEDTSE